MKKYTIRNSQLNLDFLHQLIEVLNSCNLFMNIYKITTK